MCFDRPAPEHDPGFPPERHAPLQLFQGHFIEAEIEQQMSDEIVGYELIPRLLEALQPPQRRLHSGPRFAVVARTRPHVVDSE